MEALKKEESTSVVSEGALLETVESYEVADYRTQPCDWKNEQVLFRDNVIQVLEQEKTNILLSDAVPNNMIQQIYSYMKLGAMVDESYGMNDRFLYTDKWAYIFQFSSEHAGVYRYCDRYGSRL